MYYMLMLVHTCALSQRWYGTSQGQHEEHTYIILTSLALVTQFLSATARDDVAQGIIISIPHLGGPEAKAAGALCAVSRVVRKQS